MKYPAVVQAYLDGWIHRDAKPFCCRISGDFRLQEMYGDGSPHGLAGLSIGDDLRNVAPFLDDYRWDSSVVLPLVSTTAGFASHVHLIPDGDTRIVIYLDARDEFSNKRQSQQATNEALLLNRRQHRLLEELVDAKGELDRRRREAEQNSRRKSEFIASMSHEFRTPLTSIIGYTRLLLEQDGLNERVGEKVAAIERASDHLLSLVESLLDQAKLEIGGVEVRLTVGDIRRMLEDLSILLAPLAAEKSLSFEMVVDASVPEFVEVDDLKVRQILLNLLGNAIKFTDSGSVKLLATWEDGVLRATVEDTGSGISPSDRERIFGAFQRAGEAPGRPGVGLGLTISLALAELLGGTIGIECPDHGGTVASLRLPARGVSGLAANRTGPPGRLTGDLELQRQAAHILVVEDDEEVLRLVTMHLEGSGYRVDTASNGKQAVEVALREEPDLVIMDASMPVMNGPEAARQLRDRGYAGPILAFTGSELAGNAEFALAHGFTDFLRKPFHIDELLATIVRMLLNAADADS